MAALDHSEYDNICVGCLVRVCGGNGGAITKLGIMNGGQSIVWLAPTLCL